MLLKKQFFEEKNKEQRELTNTNYKEQLANLQDAQETKPYKQEEAQAVQQPLQEPNRQMHKNLEGGILCYSKEMLEK